MVAEINPLKQGLKRDPSSPSRMRLSSCRDKSTKTRIETLDQRYVYRGYLAVAEINPLKQGLKQYVPNVYYDSVGELQR